MLEQVREVVIIVSGIMWLVAGLVFTIAMIAIFRKVSPTLDAARDFVTDLKSVSSLVTGRIMKPLTRGAIFAAGVQKAISTLSRHTHGKEKRHGNR